MTAYAAKDAKMLINFSSSAEDVVSATRAVKKTNWRGTSLRLTTLSPTIIEFAESEHLFLIWDLMRFEKRLLMSLLLKGSAGEDL